MRVDVQLDDSELALLAGYSRSTTMGIKKPGELQRELLSNMENIEEKRMSTVPEESKSAAGKGAEGEVTEGEVASGKSASAAGDKSKGTDEGQDEEDKSATEDKGNSTSARVRSDFLSMLSEMAQHNTHEDKDLEGEEDSGILPEEGDVEEEDVSILPEDEDEEDTSILPDDDEYDGDVSTLPDDDDECGGDDEILPADDEDEGESVASDESTSGITEEQQEDEDEGYSSELPEDDDDEEYSSELPADEEDSSELPDVDDEEDFSVLPDDSEDDYSILPDDEGEGSSVLPDDEDEEGYSVLPDYEEEDSSVLQDDGDEEEDYSVLPDDEDSEEVEDEASSVGIPETRQESAIPDVVEKPISPTHKVQKSKKPAVHHPVSSSVPRPSGYSAPSVPLYDFILNNGGSMLIEDVRKYYPIDEVKKALSLGKIYRFGNHVGV